MVKVKICGITNWPDAKLAIAAGADLLGFNFYRPSPRYITPARARRIIRRLPRGVRAVGVFVNESPARIRAVASAAGLNWVQLHGYERAAAVAELARAFPVMKAFRVRPGFRVTALTPYASALRRGGFLLDGYRPDLRGGTGRTFDWSVAMRARRYGRLFLAGGLTPENIAQAIRNVRPYGVDLCSGVEARPGKKDPARLREFMRRVEEANRGLR